MCVRWQKHFLCATLKMFWWDRQNKQMSMPLVPQMPKICGWGDGGNGFFHFVADVALLYGARAWAAQSCLCSPSPPGNRSWGLWCLILCPLGILAHNQAPQLWGVPSWFSLLVKMCPGKPEAYFCKEAMHCLLSLRFGPLPDMKQWVMFHLVKWISCGRMSPARADPLHLLMFI